MPHSSSNSKEKLLISACLLGQPVRYDGQSKGLSNLDWLHQLQREGRLVVVCPEVSGGLPVPRPAAEIRGEQVIASSGVDVTAEFQAGAEHALVLCQQHNIRHALLKAKSPSCGNEEVYDGRFSGQLTQGMGLTARLLSEHGIQVFSELQIGSLKLELER